MRLTAVFWVVVMALLAGVGVGYFARSLRVTMIHEGKPRAADMGAIAKLHQADIDATMNQDLNALTALWSDDAVNLGFPGPPVVGIKAMKEAFEKFKKDYPEFQVLKYVNEMKEVQIADGWAIELSESEATFKMSAKGDPVNVPRTRGMRLLKRQSDGSWKFALVGMK
jgi:uncharacterized protein (TIGR02246 family)